MNINEHIRGWAATINESCNEAGMDPLEIMQMFAADKEKAEKERAEKEAAARANENRIKSITFTGVESDDDYRPSEVTVKYDIAFENGDVESDESTFYPDDKDFRKIAWRIRKAAKENGQEKYVDDFKIALAAFMIPYKENAKYEIEWIDHIPWNEVYDTERFDKRREDFFGWSVDDIQGMIDQGWRHPLVTEVEGDAEMRKSLLLSLMDACDRSSDLWADLDEIREKYFG